MDFSIRNHWLELDEPNEEVSLTRAPERISHPIVPEVVVIHYGVLSDLDALIAGQRATGYWAHLSIDGKRSTGADHQIFQSTAFNDRGSHAGRSAYKGRPSVNGFSVGIEIANPGPLIEHPDGTLRTVNGDEWDPCDAEEARHKHPYAPRNWTWWAKYSPEEIALIVSSCRALHEEYGLKDIVGHHDIAPGRKFDPGPLFPLEQVKDEVLL